jgi:hypothetical protein
MELINIFLIKRQDFFQIFFEKFAFYGKKAEPEPKKNSYGYSTLL